MRLVKQVNRLTRDTAIDAEVVVNTVNIPCSCKGQLAIGRYTYSTGVKLTAKAMAELETRIIRLPGLEKWFVKIPRTPT